MQKWLYEFIKHLCKIGRIVRPLRSSYKVHISTMKTVFSDSFLGFIFLPILVVGPLQKVNIVDKMDLPPEL